MQGRLFLPSELHLLPSRPGVYYLLDETGGIVYIGKTCHPKERLRKHLFGKATSPQERKIKTRTKQIRFVETGSELVALLFESDEIKKFLPMLNRMQRRKRTRVGVELVRNRHGFLHMKVQPLYLCRGPLVRTFFSVNRAEEWVREQHIHKKLCDEPGLGRACFARQIHRCDGACVGEVSEQDYRKRLQRLRDRKLSRMKLIVEPGPVENEISFVYLRGGIYQGYGTCESSPRLRVKDLLERLMPKADTPDVQRILRRYLRSSERHHFHVVHELHDEDLEKLLPHSFSQ